MSVLEFTANSVPFETGAWLLQLVVKTSKKRQQVIDLISRMFYKKQMQLK
jgi:hypothetical protein